MPDEPEQLEFEFDLERSTVFYVPLSWHARGYRHAWHDGKAIHYARTANHTPDKRCPACKAGER